MSGCRSSSGGREGEEGQVRRDREGEGEEGKGRNDGREGEGSEEQGR